MKHTNSIKFVFGVCMLVSCYTSRAQTKLGNNVTSVDPSAILELENPNKALYITRVSLVNTSDQVTVPSPKAGMMVYNVNTSIFSINPGYPASGAGLYYFDGTGWVYSGVGSLGNSYWSLNGNSNAVDGVNFLGTTNNVALNFRVNNFKSGRIDLLGNTSFGYQAALNQTSGLLYNTLIGSLAGNGVTSGSSNTGVGYSSLLNGGLGYNNTAIGYRSGATYADAHDNTFVGYQADVTAVGINNATAIGSGAQVSASNSVVLGNSVANVGIGNTAPTNKLHVTGANPLRLEGLQPITSSDSVLTKDATGVVKTVATSAVIANIKANNGLTRNVDSIQLGGTLSKTTTIITAGNDLNLTGTGNLNVADSVTAGNFYTAGKTTTNTLTATGITAGSVTDSVLTINTTTGVVNRRNINSVVSGSNGLNAVNGDVRLGGTLNTPTTIDQAGNNLALTNGNLSVGGTTTTDSLHVVNGATVGGNTAIGGNLKVLGNDTVVGASKAGSYSTTGNTTTGTLTATGLLPGNPADSLLNISTTGVVAKVSPAAILSNIKANNGLTRVADSIQLGGTLRHNTTVADSIYNLSVTSINTANNSSALDVTSAPTGNIPQGNDQYGSHSTINGTDGVGTASGTSTTIRGAVNQASTAGNNVRAQGSLNEGAASGHGLGQFDQPSAVGTTGLADYTGTSDAPASDYLVGVRGAAYTSTNKTNGLNVVGMNFGGTYNNSIGGYFYPSNGTTNVGTVSQVGGVANQAWKDANLTGRNVAVAGIDYAGGANDRALYTNGKVEMDGLTAGTINDSLMTIDPAGVVHYLNANTILSNITASNGLTKVGNDIQLGGTLTHNTTVAGGAYNTSITGTSNTPNSSVLSVTATPATNLTPGTEVFAVNTNLNGTDGAPTATANPSVLRSAVLQAGSDGNNVRVQGALAEAATNGVGLGAQDVPQAVGATGFAHYGGTANANANDYVVGLRGATTTTGSGLTNGINIAGVSAGGSYFRSIGGYFYPTDGSTGNLGTVSQIGGTENQAWRETTLANKNIAVSAINYNNAATLTTPVTTNLALLTSGNVQMTNLPTTGNTLLLGVDGNGNVSTTAIPATITASNGLTKVGNDIQLGGQLAGPTTVDQNSNALNFTNGNVNIGGNTTITGTTTTDSLHIVKGATIGGNTTIGGNLKVIGNDTAASYATIGNTTTGTLTATALTAGSINDSVLTIDPAGVVHYLNANTILSNITASNGLTKVGNDIQWGGTLTHNTTITANDFNTTINGVNNTPDGNGLATTVNILNAPTALPAGTFSMASRSSNDYNGTEVGGIDKVTAGAYNSSFTTSNTNQATGALLEAANTGTTPNNSTQAIGAFGLATGGGAPSGSQARVIGIGGATNFQPGSNYNGIAVNGYNDYSGTTTTGATVGGHFDGTGGATQFGAIATVGDNSAYQTMYDPNLTGLKIGLAAVNHNPTPTPNDLALYTEGAVRMNKLTVQPTDTVLSIDGTNNVHKVSTAAILSNIKANNGLTRVADSIQLGGTLLHNTVVADSIYNMSFTSINTTNNSSALDVTSAPTGNIPQGNDQYGSHSTINGTDGVATASGTSTTIRGAVNQASTSGNNVRAQGSLNEGATSGQGLGAFDQPSAVGATGLADYNGTSDAPTTDYVVGLRGAAYTATNKTNGLNVVGMNFGGTYHRSVGGYFYPDAGTDANLGVVGQVGGTVNSGWQAAEFAGKNIGVAGINTNDGDQEQAGYFYGTSNSVQGRVLKVKQDITTPLTSGSSPYSTEMVTTYNGTENAGLASTIGGSHSVVSTTSNDFQVQGALMEGQTSGAQGDGFHGIGGFGLVSGNGIPTTSKATVLGLSGGVNFGTAGTNWNGVGVDGFANFGNSTNGRVAGGHFDGNGGATEFGAVGTVGDPSLYNTFFRSDLTNHHVGLLGANTGTGANRFAGYFSSDNADDLANSLHVTLTPSPGTLSSGGLSQPYATSSTLTYNGTESTGNLVGTTGGVYGNSFITSGDYQAQGGLLEAFTSNGNGDFTHAVGGFGLASANPANPASAQARIVGMGGAANFQGTVNNFNGIGVNGYTAYDTNPTTGRAVGGHFDGTGGATEFGVIGTVGGTTPYQTMFDGSLVNMHIGIAAVNHNAASSTQLALYTEGNVRMVNLSPGAATDDIVTIDATNDVHRTSLSTINNGAWHLTGNAGTVDGTNFLGTTDNVPLTFRVNNVQAGRIDNTASNAFFGYQAGLVNTGTDNTAMGNGALANNAAAGNNTAVGSDALNTNTDGENNTAVGMNSLQSNTIGEFNTATGVNALQSNTDADNNTANGYNALMSNTIGERNTAVGVQSLENNDDASNNTASGFRALQSNTEGEQNTATGVSALNSNDNGDGNTATGYNALNTNANGDNNTAMGNEALSQSTGDDNTAVGQAAFANMATGSDNTAIGYKADIESTVATTLTNATAIGANSAVGASNSLVLGSIAGVNAATASTKVGIGTTAPARALHVKKATVADLSTVRFEGLNEYADNTAALAAGLVAGDLYRTGDLLKIVH